MRNFIISAALSVFLLGVYFGNVYGSRGKTEVVPAPPRVSEQVLSVRDSAVITPTPTMVPFPELVTVMPKKGE